MKNTTFLFLLSFCFVNAFGQVSMELEKQPKNFFQNIPKGLGVDSLVNYIIKDRPKIEVRESDKFANSFLDNIDANNGKVYTNDSIPETAHLIINGLEFQNKNVLNKIDNFRIANIRKDSLYTFNVVKRDSLTGSLEYKDIKRKYQRPYARVAQEHPMLAHDFFLFKINTLEPVRY